MSWLTPLTLRVNLPMFSKAFESGQAKGFAWSWVSNILRSVHPYRGMLLTVVFWVSEEARPAVKVRGTDTHGAAATALGIWLSPSERLIFTAITSDSLPFIEPWVSSNRPNGKQLCNKQAVHHFSSEVGGH